MSSLCNKCCEASKQDGFQKMLSEHGAEIADYVVAHPESHDFYTTMLGEIALSDPELKQELTDEELAALKAAMAAPTQLAEAPARPSIPELQFATAPASSEAAISPEDLRKTIIPRPDPEIKEEHGEGVLVLNRYDFQNWGKTVKISAPIKTCFPTTKVGVQNCVRWAKKNGKRVRAAGYRHTWSDLYCEKNDVLISMLPKNVAEQLPTPNYPYDPNSQLSSIVEIGNATLNDSDHTLVRVGAATSNEHLRQWCLGEKRINNPNANQWTIPFNVVMVEITFGGSNAPICHGAGLRHKCLSDIVTEVEYVNANGDLVTVSDEALLKSAAGCFGLLGIVVSLTLKLDKMTYAHMKPLAKKVMLTIPPPEGYTVPSNVALNPAPSDDDLNAAWNEFVSNCENSYYNEYFWFPLQEDCWINCWNNDGIPQNAIDYPNETDAAFQAIGLSLLNFANSTIFRAFPPEWSTLIVGNQAMSTLLKKPDYVVHVSNGLHFARGIQNLRCLDIEWEIPIPGRADDPTKPDWTIVQKCWWDVINAVYKRYNANKKDIPMRLTLEMRIMGGSDITMAAQHGNDLGTCSIEMLTFDSVKQQDWQDFMQEITDEWSKHTDANGNPLKIRPHWAKQWKGLTVRGQPIIEYIKDVYKENIQKFKADLEQIGQSQGLTLENMRSMFSDNLLDKIFFDA